MFHTYFMLHGYQVADAVHLKTAAARKVADACIVIFKWVYHLQVLTVILRKVYSFIVDNYVDLWIFNMQGG